MSHSKAENSGFQRDIGSRNNDRNVTGFVASSFRITFVVLEWTMNGIHGVTDWCTRCQTLGDDTLDDHNREWAHYGIGSASCYEDTDDGKGMEQRFLKLDVRSM